MILDGDIGEVVQCDRCKVIKKYHCLPYENYYEEWMEIPLELWRGWFHQRHTPQELRQDYCRKCSEEITPMIHKFREVVETMYHINKLGAAIRERRNQDNRATEAHAGKRSEGGSKRRLPCG